MQYKGKHIDPYESFYWNTTQEFFRGQLGGGISRTVKTDDSLAVMEESILIPEATAKGYAEATDGDSVNLEQPNSKTRRGRVGKQIANTLTTGCNQGVVIGAAEVQQVGTTKETEWNRQQYRVYGINGLSPCLNCCAGGGLEPKIQSHYRIRKLTPRECFRLMDVDENVIDTIQAAGISNSQQYKLAGNSIVVACLEKIFEQMFFPQYTNSRTLFG